MRSHTNASIQDQDRHIGVDCLADLDHLLEQLRFLLVPPGCIDNNDLETFLLELCYALRSNSNGVGLRVRTKVRDLGFRSGLPRLIESTCTKGIRADDCRLETTFLIVNSELSTGRCFTITLDKLVNEAAKTR